MKKNKLLLATLFLLIVQANLFAQDISENIISALRQGNVEQISTYFNDNVELSVKGTSNIFSKQQAKAIFVDFFSKNTPKGFQTVHNGNKGNSKFVIGNLTTSEGVFRIYFLTKTANNQQLIYQLRIETND